MTGSDAVEPVVAPPGPAGWPWAVARRGTAVRTDDVPAVLPVGACRRALRAGPGTATHG